MSFDIPCNRFRLRLTFQFYSFIIRCERNLLMKQKTLEALETVFRGLREQGLDLEMETIPEGEKPVNPRGVLEALKKR